MGLPNELPPYSDIYVIFYENESLLSAYHESEQTDFSRNKMKEFTSVGCPVQLCDICFYFSPFIFSTRYRKRVDEM